MNTRGHYEGQSIRLAESLDLPRGQEVVVRIQPVPKTDLKPREPGLFKGKVHMASDFDTPLNDFKDYM